MMIRRFGPAVLAAAVLNVGAQESNVEPAIPPPPSVADLMARVRDTFPHGAWHINGELLIRDNRGEPVRTLLADIRLDLRGHPPSGRVRIADAFGAELAAVQAQLEPDGTVTLREEAPEHALSRAVPPDATVLDTGLQWSDFLFDFLWWNRGRVLGMEMKRARECWVAELLPPAPGRFASVRVWVDAREHLLLQAEGREPGGRVLRRFSVKSVRKINDRWVIEDVDFELPAQPARITLRVRESRALPREVPP
ncbi:MAG: outer membrane lipoprotein-sorting protein [Kiritimatiellae bacterium]|nr:outer membrane lipoprotein-sorting protein [Kiritimatiellia bacterium]